MKSAHAGARKSGYDEMTRLLPWEGSFVSDTGVLRTTYADERRLRVRQEIHDQYTLPRVDYAAWVTDRAGWKAPRRILDVGAGSGMYHAHIREHYPQAEYHALDHSYSMIRNHPQPSNRLVADAQALPFASATFDVVMAHHMLFYVDDIDRALSEFTRVLEPEGVLVTATNSIQTMPEFQALFRRALLLLSNHVRPNSQYLVPPHNHYSLENGVRRLSRYFHTVVRHDLPAALVFPEIEPVITYLDSLRPFREAGLPPDVTWEALMEAMYDQVNRVITLQGELIVSKLSGVLVASNHPDFIERYTQQVIATTAPH
jgi:SAM-dependent methyltransferase